MIIQMEKEELLDENREKKSAEGSRNKRLSMRLKRSGIIKS